MHLADLLMCVALLALLLSAIHARKGWARSERALFALLEALAANGMVLGPDEDGNIIIMIPNGEQE